MKDIEKINRIIEVILHETNCLFYDNPNGAYEYSCPFCSAGKDIGGNRPGVIMSELDHDSDCIYTLANDVSNSRYLKLKSILDTN